MIQINLHDDSVDDMRYAKYVYCLGNSEMNVLFCVQTHKRKKSYCRDDFLRDCTWQSYVDIQRVQYVVCMLYILCVCTFYMNSKLLIAKWFISWCVPKCTMEYDPNRHYNGCCVLTVELEWCTIFCLFRFECMYVFMYTVYYVYGPDATIHTTIKRD